MPKQRSPSQGNTYHRPKFGAKTHHDSHQCHPYQTSSNKIEMKNISVAIKTRKWANLKTPLSFQISFYLQFVHLTLFRGLSVEIVVKYPARKPGKENQAGGKEGGGDTAEGWGLETSDPDTCTKLR